MAKTKAQEKQKHGKKKADAPEPRRPALRVTGKQKQSPNNTAEFVYRTPSDKGTSSGGASTLERSKKKDDLLSLVQEKDKKQPKKQERQRGRSPTKKSPQVKGAQRKAQKREDKKGDSGGQEK